MPHSSKGDTEKNFRLLYVLVVIVEALVVASLYWLGRVFS